MVALKTRRLDKAFNSLYMKTFRYLSVVILLITTACSVEEVDTSLSNESAGVELEFTATCVDAGTRTTLIQDGTLPNGQPKMITWWSPSEEICIFYGASSGNKFTSTNTELVQIATFSGTLNAFTGLNESGDFNYFWGVYPYSAAVSCDGESVVATLADEQEAVAGSYANNTNITIAKSPGLSLGFYNVCSFLRFYVEKEGVISATFRGNNNEDVAGTFSVSFGNDGRPTAPVVTDGVKEIVLKRPNDEPFEVGTSYYFVILPQTFESGFTVQFDTETETGSRIISSSANFARNSINYGNTAFDHNVEYSGIIPTDEIWYTTTNGFTVTPSRTDNWGKTIVSNTSYGGYNVIKFSGPITQIPYNAFVNKTSLRHVYLPEGVTVVDNSAFSGCTSLSKVVLPNSLRRIEYQAFFACSSLSEIRIPSSLEYIAGYAFSGCAFSRIELPGDVQLSEGAFSQSSTLSSAVLPSNLTSIPSNLFWSCTNLESVTIPDCVLSIGGYSFNGCSSLESIDLPDNLESIGNNAFGGCTSLTSVTIPDKVTTIGEYAFQLVPISSITLPSSIETVGQGAFNNCANLTTVTLNTPNVIFGSAFSNPPIQEILGDYASANGLYYAEGNTLKGFARAAGFTEVVVPSDYTSIDNWAFGNCPNITSITLPSGIRSIGHCAFSACTGLTTITIPSTVLNMGNGILSECSALTSIVVLPTIPPVAGINMFRDTNECPIIVPAESVDSYREAWPQYSHRIGVSLDEVPTNLSKNGRANCYIVTKGGNYLFDASKQGNSNNDIDEPGNVEVLWESVLTPPETYHDYGFSHEVGSLISNIRLENNQIVFTATGNEGNALVALRNTSGRILWSWHLWFTADAIDEIANPTGTAIMMDRNLGAIRDNVIVEHVYSSTYNRVSPSYGLYYQWGRKDPFVGLDGDLWTFDLSTVGNYTTCKRNPTTLFDNMESAPWTSTIKQISDPCPPGWKVPSINDWPIMKTGPDSYYYTDNDANCYWAWEYDLVGDGLYYYNSNWYPAAGFIGKWGDEFLFQERGHGYYWAAAENSNTTPFLEFDFDTDNDFLQSISKYNNNNYRHVAMSVRCCKE